MTREIQGEQQGESQSLARMLTLALACVVWMGSFLWYYARIEGMREFLMGHRSEHKVYDFLASTYPWGGAVFIVVMLVFLLTENSRSQTNLYKTGVNIFFVIFGVALFIYLQTLLPSALQGLV